MSETIEHEAINQETINEALAVIDASLGRLHQRELVSSSEVSDVLLDVRSILAAAGLEEVAVSSPN